MTTECLLLVPAQYIEPFNNNTPADSDYWPCFDGNPGERGGKDIQDDEIEVRFGSNVSGNYAFFNVSEAVDDLRLSLQIDTGGGYADITAAGFYAETPGDWTSPTSKYLENDSGATINDEAVLIELETAANTGVKFQFAWEEPGAGAAYETFFWNLVLAEGISLPPWSLEHTRGLSAPSGLIPGRALGAGLFPSFRKVDNAKTLRRRSFRFSGLTDAQIATAEELISGLAGAVQPVILAKLTDDVTGGIYSAEFFSILIETNNVSIGRSPDKTWGLTLPSFVLERGTS